jgi:hypothetical protein
MKDEKMVKVNEDFLVTETTIDPKLPVAEVVTWLVEKKTTGQLNFSLSQGSVQKVALVERTKAPNGLREKLRHVLGV